MRSPWAVLRGLLARVGSDPYYASYERSLGNIKAEVDRLQAARAVRAKAWAAVRARFLGGFATAYIVVLAYAAYVNRQPAGTYSARAQAARVAPVFAAPLAGWAAFRLLAWLQALLDRRAARRVQQLEGKLRKQVTELKESMRYERTLALLRKYDPDYAPPRPPAPAGRTPGRRPPGAAAAGGGGGLPAPLGRAAGAAANMAGSALQGAGALMLPALGQLYSRAANTLIADDPVMLGLLQQAQQQEGLLAQRLRHAEGHVVALLHDNIALKQRMGLPTEEEQAALAAWTAPPATAAAPPPAAAADGEAAAQPVQDGNEGAASPAEPAAERKEAAEQEEEAAGSGPEEAAGTGGSASRVTRRRQASGRS